MRSLLMQISVNLYLSPNILFHSLKLKYEAFSFLLLILLYSFLLFILLWSLFLQLATIDKAEKWILQKGNKAQIVYEVQLVYSES